MGLIRFPSDLRPLALFKVLDLKKMNLEVVRPTQIHVQTCIRLDLG